LKPLISGSLPRKQLAPDVFVREFRFGLCRSGCGYSTLDAGSFGKSGYDERLLLLRMCAPGESVLMDPFQKIRLWYTGLENRVPSFGNSMQR
jgi:hypothetical protein